MNTFAEDLKFGTTGEEWWLQRWKSKGYKVTDCRSLHTYYDFLVNDVKVEIKTYRKESTPIIELSSKNGGPGWFRKCNDPEQLYVFMWFIDDTSIQCYIMTHKEIEEELNNGIPFKYDGCDCIRLRIGGDNLWKTILSL